MDKSCLAIFTSIRDEDDEAGFEDMKGVSGSDLYRPIIMTLHSLLLSLFFICFFSGYGYISSFVSFLSTEIKAGDKKHNRGNYYAKVDDHHDDGGELREERVCVS